MRLFDSPFFLMLPRALPQPVVQFLVATVEPLAVMAPS